MAKFEKKKKKKKKKINLAANQYEYFPSLINLPI